MCESKKWRWNKEVEGGFELTGRERETGWDGGTGRSGVNGLAGRGFKA